MPAKAAVVDFTNVKDGVSFNKKHYPMGDYEATVTKVEDAPAKSDGVDQWLFTIAVKTGTYPYYCKQQENQFWKIRNIITAAGMTVPKKKVRVDPNKLVGKTIGVTLEDTEYDGRIQSEIAAVFPPEEIQSRKAADSDDAEEEVEDIEEADEEEEAPAPKAKKKKAVAAEAEGSTKTKTKKKAKPAADVDDDELEELEIEDL